MFFFTKSVSTTLAIALMRPSDVPLRPSLVLPVSAA
jgi:hypothetical protein